MTAIVHILIAILLLAAGFAIGAWVTYRRDVNKITYIMDAVQDGETNFRFVDSSKINRALNRMREIFEKHRQESEVESWSKLIRVLTHEIMNTITPIATLSDVLSKDDTLDYKEGLKTIAQSSQDLINFVSSYRSLSKISAPVMKPIMVSDMINKVINLTDQTMKENGATCTYQELSEDLLLYADEGQISQILINLIKNAYQASSTEIKITAELGKQEEVIIKVSDNGQPISTDSKDQIFIPFYTTKEGGSGIGLSLSRQIMRLHNGSIELESSDNQKTVFSLIFR